MTIQLSFSGSDSLDMAKLYRDCWEGFFYNYLEKNALFSSEFALTQQRGR